MVIKAVRSIIKSPYKDLWGRRGWKGKGGRGRERGKGGKGKEETCPISLKESSFKKTRVCAYILVLD